MLRLALSRWSTLWGKCSVASRIVGFSLLLLVAGLAAVGVLLVHSLRADITEASTRQLQAIGTYAAHDIGQDLRERQQLLQRLAYDLPSGALQQPQALESWLQSHATLYPLFSQGVFVVDAQGQFIASSHGVALQPSAKAFGQSPYFAQGLAGALVIDQPSLDPIAQKAVLTMGVPILDAQRRVVGVVAGRSGIRSNNFLSAVHTTHIGKTGRLILVSPRDGVFIDASHNLQPLMPLPTPGVHQQHDAAMQGFRGVGIDTNMENEEEVAAVMSVPGSDWFLVARITTDEAFAPVQRALQFLLGSGAALLVLLVALWIVGLRKLLAPLRHAAWHAEQMTQGKQPLSTLPLESHDEVGHFVQAYNRVIDKLLESQRKLEHLAFHDGLTGLANRRHFDERLDQEWRRACRDGSSLALILLDVDYFKAFNDHYGHPQGDQCLKQVAHVLGEQTLRAGELAARYGGEEFAVVLPGTAAEAQALAERIRHQIVQHAIPHAAIARGHVTVSVGVASMVPRAGDTLDALIERADAALYRAKEQGRNRVVVAIDMAPTALNAPQQPLLSKEPCT